MSTKELGKSDSSDGVTGKCVPIVFRHFLFEYVPLSV
jgi:hypothetical protein